MVVLERASGTIVVRQTSATSAELTITGLEPTRGSLVARSVADCLAEELRRMDADGVYADAPADHDRVIYPAASVRSARGHRRTRSIRSPPHLTMSTPTPPPGPPPRRPPCP